MTPQDRLAAAIGPSQNVPYSFAQMVAKQILAADPTIAADLTLAARLRDPADPLLFDVLKATAGYGWAVHIDRIRAGLTEGEEPYAEQNFEAPYRKGGWVEGEK